jgi:CDP-6-deoxy-D-xylo-4-hexulose-3-dehydrase
MKIIHKFPLIKNNIVSSDIDSLIRFLKKKPILTQSKNVKKFEQMWSKWLGIKYSVFVNSGSSANLLQIQLLKLKYPKGGEVIVPAHTWSSDISSILHCGFKPIFVDIDLNTLGLNTDLILSKITNRTVAVFLTYVQGFNCLTNKLLNILKKKKIFLIEDVCESHGAKFKNKKLGTFGWTSSFSFYYAHHISTIEGGMVSTNDKESYNNLLMLRSHGMTREVGDKKFQLNIKKSYKDLNPQFIFKYAAYNVRNTEIGGVLGLAQLKRLNSNIRKRNRNHKYLLSKIDKEIFFTEFNLEGSSNYAFNIILKRKNKILFKKILNNLDKNGIEYRVGGAGGGNQLRQPYLKHFVKKKQMKDFKNTEHIHFYSFYIGNYPELSYKNLNKIINTLNYQSK